MRPVNCWFDRMSRYSYTRAHTFLVRKTVGKVKALVRGTVRGLEAPADAFRVNQYAYPHRSERDAMRTDWKRVGDEIHGAMKRTNGKAAT